MRQREEEVKGVLIIFSTKVVPVLITKKVVNSIMDRSRFCLP